MANYMGTSRTNYFRVTDEDKYQELFKNLRSTEDDIHDFTTDNNGVIYHGFGSYSSIDYVVSVDDEYDDEEYDFDAFLHELQKILPDDEAFMYFESGYEKLRYVGGYVLVCTNKEIRSTSLDHWAIEQAKQLLGDDFTTQTSY
jgi:hypothetical protein